MPRVSETHLTARRQQILEAAWRCFARNGFHATSMQDIFDESGLSAGAVYRYFPSKLALVKATSERITEGIEEAYDVIAGTEPVPRPDQAFRIAIAAILRRVDTGQFDLGRMAVHVWSEALREPEVREVARDVGLRVRGHWADIAGRWRAAGHIPADADPQDVARLFYGIMVGFVVQRSILGDVTPEQYVGGLTAITGGSQP